MTHGNLPLAESAAYYAQSVVRARAQFTTRRDLTQRVSLRRVRHAENLVIDCARIMMARIARGRMTQQHFAETALDSWAKSHNRDKSIYGQNTAPAQLNKRSKDKAMTNDTHNQSTANETIAPTEIEQFIESLAMNHVDAMEGLFAAIAKLSEQYSTIKKLATHGVYLAQSLHNDLDCQRGDIKAARIQAATKPASSEPLPPNVTPLH